jgi:tetratricopeptide (TPR) repeat protein
VLNTALRDDLNMRVFEVMSCGSMLLADEAPGSGFEDLFKHDIHYGLYFDETLPETARRYLDRGEECARIAADGHREALAHHTYGHRGRQIVRTVFEGAPDVPAPDIERIAQHVPQTASRILVCGGVAPELVTSLKKVGFMHVAGFESDMEFATARTVGMFDELLGGVHDAPEWAGDRFDAIVVADLLEGIAKPHRVLGSLASLLATGGSVVISVYNARWLGFVEDLVEGRWGTSEILEARRIVRPLTLADLHKALARERLEPSTVVGVTSSGCGLVAAGPEGTRFGRLSIKPMDDAAAQELNTMQFIVVAHEAADEFVEQVEKALDAGDYEDALHTLASPMAETGSETRRRVATLLRGRCNEAMDKLDEAGKAYRAVIDDDETSGEALLGLTRVSIALGNTEDAGNFIDQTSGLDLDQTLTVERGRLYLRLNMPQKAADDFRAALDNDAVCREAVLGYLEAVRETGDIESAVPYLDRYLGLRGADMEVLVEAARIDLLGGRASTAVERLETALMFNPDHKEAKDLLNKTRNE